MFSKAGGTKYPSANWLMEAWLVVGSYGNWGSTLINTLTLKAQLPEVAKALAFPRS